MTTAPARAGLLRGLAARALGQERPLRSQRAVAVELGAGAIPVHDDPPRPLAHVSDEPAAVGEQLSALARPAQPAVRMPPVPAGIVTPTLATPPLSLAGDPAATAGVALRGPKHGEPAMQGVWRPGATEVQHSAARDGIPDIDPVSATPRVAPSVMRTVDDQAAAPTLPPAALLPEAPASPWMASVASSDRERVARSAGRRTNADVTTEVHVSIGRVELTALPPTGTAAPRPAPRRDTGDGRSLADYLRGRGPHGGSRPE